VTSGFCTLRGIEAAFIFGLLGPDQRRELGNEVGSDEACKDGLLTTIAADRGAEGVSASDAWALYAAEVGFENDPFNT